MFYIQIRKVEADTKATPTPDKQFPKRIMSSVQAKDLKIGRIAVTTGKLANNNVPIGAWSVLVSDGVKQAPSAVNNGKGQGGGAASGRASRSKNVCDIIFFASKVDAFEESAYLNGKRPDSADETAARRRRSIGGQAVEMAVHEMGRMGVGLVIGENNVNGVRLLATGAIDAGGGLVQTEEQKALAAVASLKATFFQVADVSQLGGLEEVGRLLLPRDVQQLGAEVRRVKPQTRDTGTVAGVVQTPPKNYYQYQFLVQSGDGERHVTLSAAAAKGQVYVMQVSAPAMQWAEVQAAVDASVATFNLI